jgi:hypothetical protein
LNESGTDVDVPRGKMKGVNVTMRYIEMASGKIIDGNRATDMRRFAQSIWVYMAKAGTPPATWGSVDLKTREMYCKEMIHTFEELSFCDLDWKSEQIATDNYPSWRTTWTKQNQGKNQDVKPSSIPTTQVTTQVKHSQCESTKLDLKRKKLDGAQNFGDIEVDVSDAVVDLTQTVHRIAEDTQVCRLPLVTSFQMLIIVYSQLWPRRICIKSTSMPQWSYMFGCSCNYHLRQPDY